MIRLVIADDHAIMRGGLKRIFALAPDLTVVGEATNGSEVLERLRQDTFNLLLLDMNMPGISGPDLIARVKAHRPDLPILVLSMHNESQVAAIRKVITSGQYISPEIAEKMVFDATSITQHPPHSELSERELEIFVMLTQGKAVSEIATELAISNKTVSTHKVRLMNKLKLSNLAELMRYAMEHGFL